MRILYNNVFKNYILLTLTIFTEELLFRSITATPILDWNTLRIFIGINIISLILSALYSFFGRLISNILNIITALLTCIYAIFQASFFNYTGTFISFSTLKEAGAITDYINDYLPTLSFTYLLIIIPLILLILFYLFIDHRIKVLERNDAIDFADKFDSEERKKLNDQIFAKRKKRFRVNAKINAVVIALLLAGAYFYTLNASFMQNQYELTSSKDILLNPSNTGLALNKFGFTAYALFDAKATILPVPATASTKFDKEYTKVEQRLSDYTRLIDDTLWENVIEKESREQYKRLNNYFISQEITDRNEQTGFFKNKNLIVIEADSINNIILNKEYFPNIYKLYNEGWSWNNAYSPLTICPGGNSELSAITSLYNLPDKCTSNAYFNNSYPNSIFNLFNKAGYTTTSFHNYTDEYYKRTNYLKNMGVTNYYGIQELSIPYNEAYQEWPSDNDLMKKVLNNIKDQEKFMTWITTTSTHTPYNQSSELGNLYLDLFADTNYNIALKRYMSKLKEFDESLETLINGLEEQGKLKETVIVIYSSNYPYGLNTDLINKALDTDVTIDSEKDRTPFIIYNSEAQAQKHNEYTTYINMTPTIANLFDLDYDPRLYVGQDILSPKYDNRIIFADGSWQDKMAYYNARTGTIKYYEPNTTYTDEQLTEINTIVKNKLDMSALAIKTNYFDYLEKAKNEYKVDNIDATRKIDEADIENHEENADDETSTEE